jgi:membrane-bound ClpP family serine protease
MIAKLLWPVLLQFAGILVIIAEFVIPSAGILTALSVGVFGFSLYLVFSNVSFTTGMTFLIFDILLIPVVVFIGIRFLAASPLTLKATLTKEDGAVSQPPEWASLHGKSGLAVTDLRPAGSVVIDGKRYDVVSRGEYISKGSPVTVTIVDGNRVVVTKTE